MNTKLNTNVDMFVFWQVVYMSGLFMNVVFLPFMYFFYETDEDKDYKTRFCMAMRNEMIFFVCFSLIHFPMFASMRYSYIPIESRTYEIQNANGDNTNGIFLNLDNPSDGAEGFDEFFMWCDAAKTHRVKCNMHI